MSGIFKYYNRLVSFMTTVTVTRHAQITIPKKIREALGIREGDNVDVVLNNEKIIVRKSLPKIKDFRDFLPQNFDMVLEKMRKDSRERLKTLGILP
jgi:antitoxin PrlF